MSQPDEEDQHTEIACSSPRSALGSRVVRLATALQCSEESMILFEHQLSQPLGIPELRPSRSLLLPSMSASPI